ncbi:hypothetical protein PWT90_11207 [Aphanocladium album]|nr:hypothetical protein PWT90_11207 [Aphanocladium album]
MEVSSVKSESTRGRGSRVVSAAKRPRDASLSPRGGALTKRLVMLNQRLGPDFVSRRQGAGAQKYSYLTGGDAILLANAIFGNDGWSSTLVSVIASEVRAEGSKWIVDVRCHVRVTVYWCRGTPGAYETFHEAIGYGGNKPMPKPGDALEGATKEAETDATKRALRKFGEATGNCLYDKAFLTHTETQRRREGNKADDGSSYQPGNLLRKHAVMLGRGQTTLPFVPTGGATRLEKKQPLVKVDKLLEDELDDDFFLGDTDVELEL